MAGKTIEVTVSPAGDVKVEAQGYQGKGCEQATKFIEEALGTVKSDEKKTEYYQTESQSHVQQGY